jgi:signal transduction histidine kinase
VFIVDDDAKNINVFLSNPSGDSLAAWNTEYESIPLFKATVDHWKKQLVYRDEWNQKQFVQFMKSLIEHGLIDDQDNFQSGKDAPEYLALQMVPFEQGMLYVGSSEQLDKEQIELVQSLADSFSVAYARYEDFKKLEEAKGHAENTLTDLKAAQYQLIQSEKMASLGELTAGIAHEIQNPLNFVNNFSEVNKELAEELNDEIEKGNMREVRDIARDIVENEQKISHHGKRAEAIVKGMLQHSRTNTGTKELTDINILADEYLRLAYHGLRAKDKSFNADFNLEKDENIPMIKVIPQDIGRVLLNLINNAFYAVDKKVKEGIEGYKPIVSVSLGNQDDKIEIEVKDNGNGIPENVKEKIFQPFFTTKPTGHGTGLGLSLTYDIIKAHGGEINVVSEEGEGTNFKISLIKN